MAPAFSYTVQDLAGRTHKGTIEAASKASALEELKLRGDVIIDMQEAGSNVLKLELNAKLSDAELAAFSSDLKGLLETGASLPKALSFLADGVGAKKLTVLARDLKLQLELGRSASDLLLRSKQANMQLFGRFLQAAEIGGQYNVMLGIASDFLGRRAQAFTKIRSALAYPLFLVAVSVLALAFIIVFVAPSIAPLFEDDSAPAFLAVSAGLGLWIQTNPRLIFLGLASLLIGMLILSRTHILKRAGAWVLYRTPVISGIAKDLDFGPASLAFSALLGSGWPTEKAISVAGELSSGPAGSAFRQVSSNIKDGATLGQSFKAVKIVPIEIVRAVNLGEASGKVASTTNRAGDQLLERALRRLDKLASALAPVLIVVIGGAVAALMITLLSSIASLGDVALD